MLKNIFKKKISDKRLARAVEHDKIQRQQADAKLRAKILLNRLEARKQALKDN